jgi:hypothetical protein
MSTLRFIEIDGRRYLWRDIGQMRREQLRARVQSEQPVLFPLRDDYRPAAERNAAGRYREPSLFSS